MSTPANKSPVPPAQQTQILGIYTGPATLEPPPPPPLQTVKSAQRQNPKDPQQVQPISAGQLRGHLPMYTKKGTTPAR